MPWDIFFTYLAQALIVVIVLFIPVAWFIGSVFRTSARAIYSMRDKYQRGQL